MSTHATLETALLTAYKEIHKTVKPEWAVHKRDPQKSSELVSPSIPFVGKHYAEQKKKILVYASAENLAEYCCGVDTDRPWLDDDTLAENRHRKCFDRELLPNKQKDSAIPYVHLGPMETGLLLTAAMHITHKLGAIDLDGLTPRDFCERICFANYGKYSKETEYQRNLRERNLSIGDSNNYDYPTKEPALLKDIHTFIQKDFEVLQPDYVIFPKGIYENDKVFLDKVKGRATIIPIHQMLSGNVHFYIAPSKKHQKVYRKYQEDELHPAVLMAHSGMTTVTLDKYLYVYGYLDEILDSLEAD